MGGGGRGWAWVDVDRQGSDSFQSLAALHYLSWTVSETSQRAKRRSVFVRVRKTRHRLAAFGNNSLIVPLALVHPRRFTVSQSAAGVDGVRAGRRMKKIKGKIHPQIHQTETASDAFSFAVSLMFEV